MDRLSCKPSREALFLLQRVDLFRQLPSGKHGSDQKDSHYPSRQKQQLATIFAGER